MPVPVETWVTSGAVDGALPWCCGDWAAGGLPVPLLSMTPAFTSPSAAPAARTATATMTTRTRRNRDEGRAAPATLDGGDLVGVRVGRVGVVEELSLAVRHRPFDDGRGGRVRPEPCFVGLHVHGRFSTSHAPNLNDANYAAPPRRAGPRGPLLRVPVVSRHQDRTSGGVNWGAPWDDRGQMIQLDGAQRPTLPSSSSRVMSMCPTWRAVSSMRWKTAQRNVVGRKIAPGGEVERGGLVEDGVGQRALLAVERDGLLDAPALGQLEHVGAPAPCPSARRRRWRGARAARCSRGAPR